MRRFLIGSAWLWLCLLPLAPLPAQQADDIDEDYPPGLFATYTVDGRAVRRVDDDVLFVWKTAAPDPRLPAGDFRARWDGRLMLNEPDTYRFSAYVQGRVSVRIDGREVLSGNQPEPGWITGPPTDLDFGEFDFQVTFEKTAPAAQLKLYWSGTRFGREPIPPQLFFRDEPQPQLREIAQGRVAFDAHRCNRCHRREHEPLSAPAPSLARAAGGLSRDWIIKKLAHPDAVDPHAKMPHFGFNEEQAAAVAEFLLSGKAPELDETPALSEKQTKDASEPVSPERAGELLFRTVGCLACHTFGDQGTAGPFTGGDLSHLAEKRSRDWVYTWLGDPARLNRDHRMPLVKLTADERVQLAHFLTSTTAPPADNVEATATDEAAIAAGRELVAAARCANCHEIPGLDANLDGIPALTATAAGADDSCLSATPDLAKHRPAYPHIDASAVKAYLATGPGPLSAPGDFALGERLLEQKNCLNCHERGLGKGIVATAGAMSRLDPDLQGQSEALIPPALTAVGDKLLDDALATAVSGEQKRVRLPWLRVRMPKFAHTAEEKEALLAYLIGHDRIPEGGDVAPAPASDVDKSQQLIAGHELVGGKGFSCVACHAFGKFAPRDVAPGTRGSDLLQLGQRMRREYFLRWTRSPLRIVPGMEMPSFDKPVPQILGGDHDRQLAAIWDALNDPHFTVPTNPAVVEQYLVVRPDEPARIVRDVFTNHAADGGTTPRSFAVGLPNRHNVLFDLDTFSLRQWWIGDFARQRTQGKSWFWDAAGVTITVGTPNQPDIALRPDEGSEDDVLLLPLRENGTHGRLQRYRQTDHGVELEYQLNFPDNRQLQVTETLQPAPASKTAGTTGWTRRLAVAGVPEGYQAVLLHHKPQVALGRPVVEIAAETAGPWQPVGTNGATQYSVLAADGAKVGGEFHYLCHLKPEQLQPNPPAPNQFPIEPITSVPGYDGVRLPLPRSIMPTALTWTHDGKLVFTSLKGHVYRAIDTDDDGIEDRLQLFEEGLAAAYGVIADGADLIVAHKPELLRLRDTDGDGRADFREVIATGWGYNDNYHDWTTGIVRDTHGNLYVGLGSDYAQKNRLPEHTLWRGKVLKIDPAGNIEPQGHDLRYPTGLAIDQFDRVYMSDQQGVQNTFNEINHLVPGRGYGVTSPHRESPESPAMWPAIQVPHPWTRSINGIFFLNPKIVADPDVFGPFAGHGIGCEYDTRALIRFTTQQVGDVVQGATYRLSDPNVDDETATFTGALSGAVSPDGDIYIGSIHDSGWLGGLNLGDIVRLRPNGNLPLGIRELRAHPGGFTLSFTGPVDRTAAANPENYTISAYTRVWQGGYATPDSGRHKVAVTAADVSADGREVVLTVDTLKEKFVYEVSCGRIGHDPEKPLWPAVGYYTMSVVPTE